MKTQNNGSLKLANLLRGCGFEVLASKGETEEDWLLISGSLDNAAVLMEAAMAGDVDVAKLHEMNTQAVVKEDKVSDLISLLRGCGFRVRCPDEVDGHHPLAVNGTYENVRMFLASAAGAHEHYQPGVMTRRLVQ